MKQFILLILFLTNIVFALPTSFAQSSRKILPSHSGKYSVGVQHFELQDPLRQDLLDSSKRHRIPISIYYPTAENLKNKKAYIAHPELLKQMIAQAYNHQDSTSLLAMAAYTSQTIPNAAIAKTSKYPLLLFSHGLGVSQNNYLLFFEEWASKGYIVIAIEHPYGGFTIFEDGQLSSSRQDPQLASQDKGTLLKILKQWAMDISLVLDMVTTNTSKPGKAFAAYIRTQYIAAIGHSLGGNAAVLASLKDTRIKAAINMDGGTFDDKTNFTYKAPILTLRSQPVYTDEELISRGRNRTDWNRMGQEIDEAFAAEMSHATLGYELKIAGAAHMTFSDAPFVLPDMITRFGGKIIEAERGFRLINEVIHIFLENVWSQQNISFTQLVSAYSEVSLKIYRNR
ncbi:MULTISPECIES: alpha/beta hydrolase family protein [Aequorivita]|uniref:Alpha/beta hydrolase n=1 Tax=Aequorivita iocasae TaxID=2803865 RepID=A0ABX7DNE2_9FLAO|nr:MULTISPECIES: hypothetical protein [Aequorivita]QQX75252.1 hypothetical protein JK629_07735 [Aequorivita iocasae]UCA54700.1 hypothetical protein LDL78_07780 [Aequorivita sp. F7]